MKKLLLFLAGWLLMASASFAQHWSLFSSLETKTYYTNAFGYLTGMRIDSTKSINGNTVYYPFKTIRTPAMPTTVDTGASWLGDAIVENTDSTYIITHWHDTLIIKNNAQLGDSWTLYNDTSDIYFIGTVTSIDTLTIANNLDSVKTITIYPMQGNNILMDDSLYNMQFTISKSNGLIKALPFYFFPFYNYHKGYLDLTYDYYLNSYRVEPNFNGGLTFNKIAYLPMQSELIYNYEVGDVLVYELEPTYNYGLYITEIDTIKSKQTNNNTFTYDVGYVRQSPMVTNQGLSYQTTFGSKTLSYPFIMMEDTTLMPEEFTDPDLEFYLPNDSSLCVASALYNFSRFQLSFEAEPIFHSYKNGLGLMNDVVNYFPIDFHSSVYLTGAIKNGQFCGSGNVLAIHDVLDHSEIKVFPNPATDFITINCTEIPAGKAFNIEITDAVGKQWGQWKMDHTTKTINTTTIPNGMYFLKISDGEKRLIKKISVLR